MEKCSNCVYLVEGISISDSNSGDMLFVVVTCRRKLGWSMSTYSDCLSYLNAYLVYYLLLSVLLTFHSAILTWIILYTVVHKRTWHFIFVYDFGVFWSIFKMIFVPLETGMNTVQSSYTLPANTKNNTKTAICFMQCVLSTFVSNICRKLFNVFFHFSQYASTCLAIIQQRIFNLFERFFIKVLSPELILQF